MSYPDEELRKAVALFRYGLIADVLRLPPGSREIRRTLHEKAQRTYTIPGTRRTRVALETMRDWLSLYRTGGFEALYPKARADRGRARRMPPGSKGARRLKADDTDPELPWPTEFAYERIVGYGRGGDVYVRSDVQIDEKFRKTLELAIDDGDHGGVQRKAILNLNHPTLVESRRAAMDSERTELERDLRHRTASREERAERATELLYQNPLPEHVSIRVAWPRKTLGRGR